jgi:hypothetical protein
VFISLLLLAGTPGLQPDTPKGCEDCARWNRPHAPVHVFGNTWWVGVQGLSVVAIDTGAGLILLDAALPESVPRVKASMAAAGLKLSDVKLIGSSHAHFDHVGGIAQLQRETGAEVVASPRSAEVLRSGCPTPDDPQAGFGCEKMGSAPVKGPIRILHDGEVLKLGAVELTAHFTPGHTPGSTTWTWKSCEGSRCLNVVYADSMTPVSAEGFQFSTIQRAFMTPSPRSARRRATSFCLRTPTLRTHSNGSLLPMEALGQTLLNPEPAQRTQHARGPSSKSDSLQSAPDRRAARGGAEHLVRSGVLLQQSKARPDVPRPCATDIRAPSGVFPTPYSHPC